MCLSHARQTHESTVMWQIVVPQRHGRPCGRPLQLSGDRSYDARRIVHWLQQYGIRSVIPPRRRCGMRKAGPVGYDAAAYRALNVVEGTIVCLKECRSVATWFEKLALNDRGFVHLAMIQRVVRILAPSTSLS